MSPVRFVFVPLVLCFGLSCAGPAAGQSAGSAPSTDEGPPYVWLAGGVGVTAVEKQLGGFSVSVAGGYPVRPPVFVGGRLLYVEELVLFGPQPPATTWDVGPLVGLSAQGRYGQLTLGTGAVLVGGRRRAALAPGGSSSSCILFCGGGRYTTESFLAPGIPFDAQVVFTPAPAVGLGLHGAATITPRENLFGVSMTLMIRIPR